MSLDKDLNDRLTRLEAVSEERWKSHDAQAATRHNELREALGTIFKKLNDLPCAEHKGETKRVEQKIEERCRSIDNRFTYVWTVLVGVLMAIVGGAIKMFGNGK